MKSLQHAQEKQNNLYRNLDFFFQSRDSVTDAARNIRNRPLASLIQIQRLRKHTSFYQLK